MNLLKKILPAILALAFSASAQVTVQMQDVKVNNTLIGSNPVAFTSSNTVNITMTVKLATTNGSNSNIFGNLYVYTRDTTNGSAIIRNNNAVTFTVSYPPFVTETTYNASIYFTVSLNKADFYATGGVLYADYLSNAGNHFVSSEIAITGGSRVSPPSYGSWMNVPNAICCDQFVREGDKADPIFASVVSTTIPFNVWWHENGTPLAYFYRQNYASDRVNVLDLGYMNETATFQRYIGNDYPYNASDEVTITIIPNAIIGNSISTNGSLVAGETSKYEINSGQAVQFDGGVCHVNLAIYNDPYHPPQMGDPMVTINSYQWQYRKSEYSGDKKWYDIPGATGGNLTGFTATATPNDFYIRRIARYVDISRVSREIEIIVRNTSQTNVICCSQDLQTVNGSLPAPQILTGSVPSFEYTLAPVGFNMNTYSISYQWESKVRTNPWTAIAGATQKNYQPPTPTIATSYRRKCTINYQGSKNGNPYSGSYVIYSDPVSITVPTGRRRMAYNPDIDEWNVSVFPNPVSSILNIESDSNTYDIDLKIVNMLGAEQSIFSSKVDSRLIQVDVSTLSQGLYILTIKDANRVVQKKFLKK